ncbi:MAG: CBS domain-containing protein [Firmicutes bacterium]|nr:CBS domain-containing protein [Bacillota bacterium]
MNVAFFLTLRSKVTCINVNSTVRQALETMKKHGYTAVPVITDDNKYIGTVSEGDFLWSIVKLRPKAGEQAGSAQDSGPTEVDIRHLEDISIMDILRKDRNPAVPVTAPIEELLTRAMNQNFIPVTDDLGTLIGIVTRKTIIKYCTENGVPVK